MGNFNLSLKTKAIIGIGIVLLPIVFSFSLGYHRNKADLEKRIIDTVTVFAETHESNLYLFLEKLKQHAIDFSSDGVIRNQLLKKSQGRKIASGALSRHLTENKLSLCKSTKAIHVISTEGQIIASTDNREIGRDCVKEDFFLKGKEGMSITEMPIGYGGTPELVVSTPVVNKSTGALLGVIANFIHISELNKLLHGDYARDLGAFSWDKGKTSPWETLEIYLVNREKYMITESIFVTNAVLKQKVNTTPVNLCLESRKEMSGFYKDYRGIMVAGASMYIPSMEWVLLAEIDKDEIFAPIYHIRQNLLITAAVVVVMAVLLCTMFIRKLVNPLRTVSTVAKNIATGNFGTTIPVKAHDEIGLLCQSFNNMVQHVNERTTSLMQSEARLAEAQRIAHIGNWEWDIIKNAVYWSDEAYHIFGLPRQAPGTTYEAFLNSIHPTDMWLVKEAVHNALYKNKPFNIEYRIVRNEASPENPLKVKKATRFVHGNAVIVSDDTGKVVRMVGTVQDITERKQSEYALYESEEKLKAILDNAVAIIYVKDIQGRYTFANRQHERLFHVKRDEIRGKTDYDIWPPEQADTLRANDLKIIETRAPYSFDEQVSHDDGLHTYISTKFPLFNHKGDVYAVAGISTDITERIQTEERLRKLSCAIEQSPSVVVITDTWGNIQYVNPQFTQLTGYTLEEVVGKNPHILKSGETSPEIYKQMWKTISAGNKWRGELCNKKKNGELYWEAVCISPIKNPEGVITNYIGVAEDTTRIREEEKEKQTLREQLYHAQKLDSIGKLAGGIAHDFNNIMTAIIGYGNLIQLDMEKNSPLKPYIQKIIATAEKAADLTRGLLTFSRKQAADPKPMKLNDCIKGVRGILTRLIGENIELRTMLTDKDCVIIADSTQVDQVLINLATNARDAMPDGGTLTISTDITEIDNAFIKAHGFGACGKYALISVSDTGTGMDEKTKEQILEPFFTTKEVGKGTGLGLAIVYGIITQHEGYIQVHSEVAKGTIFKIYLPVVESAVEKINPDTVATPKHGSETILLAEDDANVRKLIKTILEWYNYTVIETVDGEDAVNKFAEKRDVIQFLLLDVVMPKKSGSEVYREIKKMKPDIKTIFISGYANDVIQEKIPDGIDFFPKPIVPARLLNAIRAELDGCTSKQAE